MSNIVSEESKNQLTARISTGTTRKNWDKTKVDLLLGLGALEFDEAFTRMLSGYEPPAPPEPVQIVITPPTGPLVLPKTFDPAKFIGSGWTIWKGDPTGKGLKGDEEQDSASLALTEIDFTKLTKEANFLTGLESGETYITGEVKRARLIVKAIQADARIGQALFEEEGQTTLRWLFDTLGITWFELLGTTLRGSDGYRYALCLYRQGDGSWNWLYRWLDYYRRAGNPALSLASKS